MKTVYLVLGSIGSGKSVIADFILSDKSLQNIEYIGSDIYKKTYFNWDINVNQKGYRCADELVFYRIEQICKSKKDFAYEFSPTNLNKIETIKYLLRKYDYRIISFFIGTERKEINVNRCKKREKEGADKVSEDKVKRRYDEAFNRILEIIFLSQKMYFIDNSEKVPKVIARLSDNILEVFDDNCKWFANNIEQKIILRQGEKI